MQPTADLAIKWGLLTRGAAAGSGTAPLEGALGAKTPFITRLEPNFCHYQNPRIYRPYYNRFKAALRGTSGFFHGSLTEQN